LVRTNSSLGKIPLTQFRDLILSKIGWENIKYQF
jgi:hypothetical protein